MLIHYGYSLQALSPYQAGLMSLIESIESQYETKGVHHTPLEGQARVEAAHQVWKGESGFSGTVLILAWLLKVSCAPATGRSRKVR